MIRNEDLPPIQCSEEIIEHHVVAHREKYGCAFDSGVAEVPCPCGRKVLVMCNGCATAVFLIVDYADTCPHELLGYEVVA